MKSKLSEKRRVKSEKCPLSFIFYYSLLTLHWNQRTCR